MFQQISFPTPSNGKMAFNFSLSSTADMEGPGGSFECIQHVGPHRDLKILGAMSQKMRIQANDDIYEATRHRMAVVEENHKNKCTREIKPNQTDIGRKVKVKQTTNRILPLPRREPPSSIPPPSSANSIPIPLNINKHSSSVAQQQQPTKPTITTSSSAASYQQPSLTSRPSITSKSIGSSCVTTSTRPPPKPSNNIMKRPIKERLIHLLALRPFKKPELYDRLIKGKFKPQTIL